MKILSLDLETTSLEPHENHILMVSAVFEDLREPRPYDQLEHFTCILKRFEITGQPYALAMNKWILDIMTGKKKLPKGYDMCPPDQCWFKLENFIYDKFGSGVKATLAGKNVGTFDLQFLPKSIQRMCHHRVLDVGPLFVDPLKDDKVQSMSDCLKRAGLPDEVTHDAYEDAIQVIRLLRASFGTETVAGEPLK